jgi:hypothetical protein
LGEAKNQIRSLTEGLGLLIPLPILFGLFTWKDMRYLVCGNPDIDLDLLKVRFHCIVIYDIQRHTRYRAGVKPTDAHVEFFWDVLADFSPYERTLFLRFAWGRERLPPENDFTEEMKIFPNNKENQDLQLPHADTCFFNVSLPVRFPLILSNKILGL